jgi:hypothetical protein
MAIQPDDLGVNSVDYGSNDRRAAIAKNGPAHFLNVAGAPILLQWSPLTYDATNQAYIAWVDGAQLDSFVAYGDVQLHATNDVLGTVPVEFEIDLQQFVINGTTQTAAALLTAALALNIRLGGLRLVRNVTGGSIA